MERRNVVPVLILVVIAALAVVSWRYVNHQSLIPSALTPAGSKVVPRVVSSVNGGYVEDFPRELVLPKDAKPVRSSNVHIDSQGLSVISAVYNTSANLPTLFAAYLGYFTDNGYKISLSDSKISQSRIIAKNSAWSVGVTIGGLDLKTIQVEVNITLPDTK